LFLLCHHLNAKIKIIVRTTPKIIPPTNEAPSNFLPVSGDGTGVALGLIEAFVTVDDVGSVILLVGEGVDVVLVGDICAVIAFLDFVAKTVLLETAETVHV